MKLTSLFLLLACSVGWSATNSTPINGSFLQSDVDARNKNITNAAIVTVRDVIVNNPSFSLTNFHANVPSILEGFDILPASATSNTNNYWLDMGRTNSIGQPLIYGTLLATNDSSFIGVTNVRRWSLLSLNIIASGANRALYFPTTFPHFATNGFVLTNSLYRMTLTNGNEFRLTIQSNNTLSTTWSTFGQ